MTRVCGPRVLFIGEFGCGNYGNDGSLEVVAGWIAEQVPGARVAVVARDAARVREELGLEAYDWAFRPVPGLLGKLIGRATDPLRYARRVLRADAVVVPGMGVLEGELGQSAFGVPYFLALVGVLCRLARRPYLLVGVGASPMPNRSSRLFARALGSLATYRSFRDQYSKDYALSIGAARSGDPVTADVAFALAPADQATAGRSVAIGVMDFYGSHPSADAEVRDAAHRDYVETMAAVVEDVLARDRDVVLYGGDDLDRNAADEIVARVRIGSMVGDSAGAREGSVQVSVATNLREIVDGMAAADLVVAARYHNIIAGFLAGRPVVALGYAEKSRVLMDVGTPPYGSDPLDGLSAGTVLARLKTLEARYALARDSFVAARASLGARSTEDLHRVADLVRTSGTRRWRAP